MGSKTVEYMFQRMWPRIYFDTAVFFSIGRGLLEAPLIEQLIAEIERRSAIVVVSHAHSRDLPVGDHGLTELLASVLERFWIRALVMEGPAEIEPWQTPEADIVLEPCANIREVLTSPAAEPVLEAGAVGKRSAHAAAVAFKEGRKATTSVKQQRLSNNFEAIVVGSSSVLGLGLAADAAEAVDYGAKAIRQELKPAERDELIALVLPVEASVKALEPVLSSLSKLERLGIWKYIRATATDAPGTWLAKVLAGERARNLDGKPLESDSVDLEHCGHFPYVDIATCDRQAYASIAPRLRDVKGSRTPQLFKNGQIEELLAHLKTLPTKEELRDRALRLDLDRDDGLEPAPQGA
ncbi:MAG TPA: hypothetical protein VGM90_21525 [Kofleriaceae bacterium]|jgi:hypothetical protein